jgi:hypothetical protein
VEFLRQKLNAPEGTSLRQLYLAVSNRLGPGLSIDRVRYVVKRYEREVHAGLLAEAGDVGKAPSTWCTVELYFSALRAVGQIMEEIEMEHPFKPSRRGNTRP